MKRIDAAGLACPQPVLLTLEKINQAAEDFEISVSSTASVENVTRAAESKNWKIKDVRTEEENFILTVARS